MSIIIFRAILIILAIIFVLIGLKSLPLQKNKTFPIVMFYLSAALVLIAAIGPLSLKKFSLGSKGIYFERYEYTPTEKTLALNTARKNLNLLDNNNEFSILLQKATERNDNERAPEDYLLLSANAFHKNELDASVNFASTGISLASVNFDTTSNDNYILSLLYTTLGASYYYLKHYDLAEREFKKAIDIHPENYNAYLNLGIMYARNNKNNAAEGLYKQAIHINPNYAPAYINLGSIYLTKDNFSEAEKLFRDAIILAPDIYNAYHAMGVIYEKNGNTTEAIKSYRQAVKINPQHKPTYNNLSMLLKKTGKIHEANELLEGLKE